MATTIVTVKAPAVLPSTAYHDNSLTGISSTAAAPAKPQTTFAPVSDKTISDIMSYVSLGLGDLQINEEAIPGMLYKWHTWLKRMNDWMKDNIDVYPKYLTLPAVRISADLYFLADPNYKEQLQQAKTAVLGPLLPSDLNTMQHALQKGLSTCAKATDIDLVKFLTDVNKIAVYAIQPQTQNWKDAVEKSTTTSTLSNGIVSNYKIIPEVGKTVVKTTNPIFLQSLAPGNIVEKFGSYDDTSPLRGNTSHPARSKYLLWLWVGVLMAILYFFVKRASAGDRISISISDFKAPY